MLLRYAILFSCLALLLPLSAQVDSIPPASNLNEQRLEDLIDDAEEEGDFDFDTAFESLSVYEKKPLNINKVQEDELQSLGLLSDVQIANLLNYRAQLNGFISIYELQAVPGLDLASIRRMLPYVTLNKDVDDLQVSLKEMLTKGENQLYMRWTRVLEEQKGFRASEENPDSSAYFGDPNQFYIRYRHLYSNRFSFGITAEKDRGEEFFTGSNKEGFDYYSAHLFLRNYNKHIKAIALGDYTASFGQGLILFSGFGYGKSALTTSVRRGGYALKQYTSVNEANFFRGAATTLAINDQLEFTALASWRNMDANIIERVDTLDNDFGNNASAEFSSLLNSGLHRTANEIADENTLKLFSTGASLKWKATKGHIAVNGIHHQLDKKLTLTPRPDNKFNFQSDQLTNISIDYGYRWRNITLFGETATSDNGAIATVNGLLTTFHKKVNFAAVYRHYTRDFQTITGNPFGETRGGRNETGLYLGMEIFPHKNWIISAYYDTWQHPWLRFTADAPSKGHEYRLRLTYFQKRKMDTYLEVRNEIKDRNIKIDESNIDAVLAHQRFQARLHFSYKINKALQWRSRVDWGFADNPINNKQEGTALYQDLLYYPIGVPFIFTTRLAFYDTDGYNIRFYNYENGLLYNFRIPAYYGKGTRFYFNVRYKGIRNVTLEARYARWFKYDDDNLGSGNEETGKPHQTDIGVQMKIKF